SFYSSGKAWRMHGAGCQGGKSETHGVETLAGTWPINVFERRYATRIRTTRVLRGLKPTATIASSLRSRLMGPHPQKGLQHHSAMALSDRQKHVDASARVRGDCPRNSNG